jgi:cytidylate kinase
MRHIILLGASGVGKTHIAKRLSEKYGYHAQDTGDLFKAWMSLLTHGIPPVDLVPDTILLETEAARHFIVNHMPAGLLLYEELKSRGTVNGRAIVAFIESLRCGHNDLPADHVLQGHLATGKPVVTAAVSQAEFDALMQRLKTVFVVRLICQQRRAVDGENRKFVSHEEDLLFEYQSPMESYRIADSLGEALQLR